jgi:hypothetical protein
MPVTSTGARQRPDGEQAREAAPDDHHPAGT